MSSRRPPTKYRDVQHHCRVLLRRIGCMLATASLLPVLLFGPLGPGTIVIHDHHEEDLHTHRVHPGPCGASGLSGGHDHPNGAPEGAAGTHLVLTVPDLTRVSPQAESAAVRVKPASPPAAVASIATQYTALPAADFVASESPLAALRALDRIAALLMNGHAFLI